LLDSWRCIRSFIGRNHRYADCTGAAELHSPECSKDSIEKAPDPRELASPFFSGESSRGCDQEDSNKVHQLSERHMTLPCRFQKIDCCFLQDLSDIPVTNNLAISHFSGKRQCAAVVCLFCTRAIA
jgi:hypothetical protein